MGKALKWVDGKDWGRAKLAGTRCCRKGRCGLPRRETFREKGDGSGKIAGGIEILEVRRTLGKEKKGANLIRAQ